ncbi:hypothetical protein Patl1_22754 [Pistacia atlantica]|uniref:Uncharacterized protein n=1 Tax=Pistacia atlantica TaxID=434234 RepID=A0ACC0ZXR5_9ROSI|nr:hypothetical protein Patl1_22754 [Pistacia atlantica]
MKKRKKKKKKGKQKLAQVKEEEEEEEEEEVEEKEEERIEGWQFKGVSGEVLRRCNEVGIGNNHPHHHHHHHHNLHVWNQHCVSTRRKYGGISEDPQQVKCQQKASEEG